MYIVFAVLISGLLLVLFFILGALFCRHIIDEAQEQARYEALRYEYYKLAGVRTPSDPKPYVPPVIRTPRAHAMLPGMGKLDRLLRDGKRGTMMWRAGDRNKSAGQSTTN